MASVKVNRMCSVLLTFCETRETCDHIRYCILTERGKQLLRASVKHKIIDNTHRAITLIPFVNSEDSIGE